MKHIFFWAMCSEGTGLSGGDRIYIEFAKRWSCSHKVTIVSWQGGTEMMARNNLLENSSISFITISIPALIRINFALCYFYRIVASLFKSLTIIIPDPADTLLYSASEFWMDSFAGIILKLRYPKLIWAATWYQTAPSPLKGFSEKGREKSYFFNAWFLWLAQLPVKPLIRKLADVILVNNDLEKKVFPKANTIVVLGAVDVSSMKLYLSQHSRTPKIYTAVFQGRFHPQKGVVELIDIWKKVVDKSKSAKLVMIGDGPLMPEVKNRIEALGLNDNIDLEGYVFDGAKKYKLFSQSKMAVHPAFFDSGGMATAEAMAFGMPAIGFDLPAYATYYPVGMIKVPIGDIEAFANAITSLTQDKQRLTNLGKEAGEFISNSYSWDYRAQETLRQIVETTN